MAKLQRIICYAVNGAGLGHVTRLVSVARWLRRYVAYLERRPPEVLFLTSGEASDVLARAGLASFKIPSKTVVRQAGMDPLAYRRLAKQLVWQVLGVFNPDLLVVDTFPSGSFDELFQLLDGPFAKGFIFRGVKPEYAARPVFKAALGLYDVVVVPHSPGAGSPGPELDQLAGRVSVSHCGEVVQLDRGEALEPAAARQQLGLDPAQRLIYLSAGGGGDPGSEAALQAMVRALRGEPDLHLLVGAGPLYRGRRLGGPNLTWFTEPGICRYFSACDAAVSAAGYNTFFELLYMRVPTLFFAQQKVADDQALRISQARQQGACEQLDDVHHGAELLRRLRQVLQPERQQALRQACAAVVADNGARRCARQLLAPVVDSAQLAWAAELLSPRLVHAVEQAAGDLTPLWRWLPRLVPPSGPPPGGDAAMEALLQQVSDQAAQELRQALAARAESRDLASFCDGLVSLVQAAAGAQLPVDSALSTLEAALKKHPLTQQARPDRLPWIAALATGLSGLLRQLPPDTGMSAEQVLQLYRVSPRLVDADADAAMAAFSALVRAMAGRGLEPHEVVHQLQVLKATSPRVTLQQLQALADQPGDAQ